MKKKSTSQSAPARLLAREDFRSSLGEGGFLNLRVLFGLCVMLAGVFLALFATANIRPDSPLILRRDFP
jgi:hypothetical protein